MILKKIYNPELKVQKVWYDSSMIAYTEMFENENENKGDLHVTFKNGSTYIYKDVLFEDYILFIGGGTDASQGKTLNKVIKSKYEFEKSENKDVKKLFEILEGLNKIDNDISEVFFISGHRNITESEFEINYIPKINDVLSRYENATFIMGDYYGVDIMAQNYLIDVLGIEPERITVYHMFDKPRNCNIKITNKIGGFKTDDERDEAMTNASSFDIAFVRDNNIITGTSKNILRRYKLISI